MQKNRLEAFSDGVLAIIITVMVLELKVPHGQDLQAVAALWPVFFSYVLSFIYIAIYWNNHHHMLQSVKHVNGVVLWSNMHLLFWLSLIPFTTSWMGENQFGRLPTFFYGANLLACAVAYYVLQTGLINLEGTNSVLARAIGSDWKGKVSPILYITGMLSDWFLVPFAGIALYVLTAFIWLIPDRRIEKLLNRQ